VGLSGVWLSRAETPPDYEASGNLIYAYIRPFGIEGDWEKDVQGFFLDTPVPDFRILRSMLIR